MSSGRSLRVFFILYIYIMDKKKSFILYYDQYKTIQLLSQEEKWELLDAIYQSHNWWISFDISPKVELVFSMLEWQFSRDSEKREAKIEARRLAWSKWWKQKVANASKTKQKVANVADTVNDTVTVTVTVNDNNKELFIFSDAVEEKIQEFIEYRKQSRKKMTDKAIELLRKDIKNRSLPDNVVISQIETSIMRGYVWVFKPSDKDLDKLLPDKVQRYSENVRGILDKMTPLAPWSEPYPERKAVTDKAKAQYWEQFFLDAKKAYAKYQNSI